MQRQEAVILVDRFGYLPTHFIDVPVVFLSLFFGQLLTAYQQGGIALQIAKFDIIERALMGIVEVVKMFVLVKHVFYLSFIHIFGGKE